MAHMVENTGAADVRFTSGEIAELNAAGRAIEIKRQRLPDAILPLSGPRSAPAEIAALKNASSPSEAMYWTENGAYR